MQGVFRWDHSVDNRFRPREGVIAVQFDHRAPLRHGLARIDLDLIVLLDGRAEANA